MDKEVYLTKEEIEFLVDWYRKTRECMNLTNDTKEEQKQIVNRLDEKFRFD
jgi:hypothetical protein